MTDGGDSDSGDAGDFDPGPPRSRLQLSEVLSQLWEMDRNPLHDSGTRRDVTRAAELLVQLGDEVIVIDWQGRELLRLQPRSV